MPLPWSTVLCPFVHAGAAKRGLECQSPHVHLAAPRSLATQFNATSAALRPTALSSTSSLTGWTTIRMIARLATFPQVRRAESSSCAPQQREISRLPQRAFTTVFCAPIARLASRPCSRSSPAERCAHITSSRRCVSSLSALSKEVALLASPFAAQPDYKVAKRAFPHSFFESPPRSPPRAVPPAHHPPCLSALVRTQRARPLRRLQPPSSPRPPPARRPAPSASAT